MSASRAFRATKRRLSKRADLLLVCQPGGHLHELLALEPIWSERTRAWFTLRSPDTRYALADERVFFGFGPTPRSVVRLVQNTAMAALVLLLVRPRWILTTGAALAVPTAWIGRLCGAKTVYVECAGRVDGVSLSMRLIAPIAHALYVQWPDQVRYMKRSVFRGRIPQPTIAADGPTESEKPGPVVAIVGTTPYPFDRFVDLADQLAATMPVLLQTGITRRRSRNAERVAFLEPHELAAACDRAQAIIIHGGIGSASVAWNVGVRPIIVPRRMALGENVDDHQLEFARRLEELGLAFIAEDLETLRSRIPEQQAAQRLVMEGDVNLLHEIERVLSSAAR